MTYYCTCNQGKNLDNSGYAHQTINKTEVNSDGYCSYCGYHATTIGRFTGVTSMIQVAQRCEALYKFDYQQYFIGS